MPPQGQHQAGKNAYYPREPRGSNFYNLDRGLKSALAHHASGTAAQWEDILTGFGAWVGTTADAEAEYTDRHVPPVLEPYTRDGDLVNHIRHNPAWERASREVYEWGIVGLNYPDDDASKPAPYLVTFVMGYLLSQANVSLHCPVTMTGAVAYVLDRFAPAHVRNRYLHELTRRDGKALSGGTWATEHHGGSDVGATTTVAREDGDAWRLTGLKWFTSNANGGLALATARPEGAEPGSRGLGAYLVPTHLEDGSPNPMRIRRLKEKLGTKGVPTGEIDLTDTWAVEVAPPPRGFKLMMEALEFSRIHNAMASVGLQRRALMEAMGFAAHREAFGNLITSYPMVQDEVLGILVPLEAGLAMALECACALDRACAIDVDESNDPSRVWLRVATALAKYATAEDAVRAAQRAIELIGGNGYTDEYATTRVLRDAQVTTVWEGPANIQALELLRLLGNRYNGFGLFEERVRKVTEKCQGTAAQGIADVVSTVLEETREAVGMMQTDSAFAARHARRLLGLMADVFAVALLLDHAAADLSFGDSRKLIIARLYLDSRFPTGDVRGIEPGREWTSEVFDALVHYKRIPMPPASALSPYH